MYVVKKKLFNLMQNVIKKKKKENKILVMKTVACPWLFHFSSASCLSSTRGISVRCVAQNVTWLKICFCKKNLLQWPKGHYSSASFLANKKNQNELYIKRLFKWKLKGALRVKNISGLGWTIEIWGKKKAHQIYCEGHFMKVKEFQNWGDDLIYF